MSLRIVSLLPSATEIICELGLQANLVGVSHECDYPAGVEALPRLTEAKLDPSGTSAQIDQAVREILKDALSVYRIDTETLRALKPDIIVTQDQCEVCAVSLKDVEQACSALGLPNTRIVSLKPDCLADVKADFQRVAQACEVPERGETLVARFEHSLQRIQGRTLQAGGSGGSAPRVLSIEWLQPPMIAGGWIPELVKIASGAPQIITTPERFATVDWPQLLQVDPDVVVLMPCGFEIGQSTRELNRLPADHPLLKMRATREGRTFVVDGNAFFNRPGPRLVQSTEILAGLFYPSLGMTAGAIAWP